jgi:general secretion pathway protein G
MKNRKGFTLIELLVVIFIIGLLTTIIYVSTGYLRAKSRDAQKLTDINKVASALESYYPDAGHNRYPAGDFADIAGSSTSTLVAGGYLQKAINNSGANPIGYETDASGIHYKLYFDPEVNKEATCTGGCSGHGDIYLIKDGKPSSSWSF